MCDRLSWTELPGGLRLGPLTTYDLFDTEQGRRVRTQYTNVLDWWGHSAIAWFFTGGTTTIENGKMCECRDFSSPGNFPPDIAEGIRAGKYLDIVAPGLLSGESYARWSCEWPELSQARAAGARPALRGARPAMRGARPVLRGARPSLRCPRPELRGAKFTYRMLSVGRRPNVRFGPCFPILPIEQKRGDD